MRKDQTSLTALGIAVMRAVESEKPESDRICFDPYARRFLPDWFYRVMRFFIVSGYAERRGRGVIGFLAARERFFDDFLLRCLDEGFRQLVILGAGYDSRAYRFESLSKILRVFEVDHPATQKVKVDRVRKIFGCLPAHVTYVPVDFEQQTLKNQLFARGYDPQMQTAFLWQGVTYYLDADAVDSTLGFIAQNAAPGSRLIFDYLDQALLRAPANHAEISNMRRYSSLTGEDLRFGIPCAEIEPFLTRRGFDQVVNVRSEALKALYFHGMNQSRAVVSGYAIVSARVR